MSRRHDGHFILTVRADGGEDGHAPLARRVGERRHDAPLLGRVERLAVREVDQVAPAVRNEMRRGGRSVPPRGTRRGELRSRAAMAWGASAGRPPLKGARLGRLANWGWAWSTHGGRTQPSWPRAAPAPARCPSPPSRGGRRRSCTCCIRVRVGVRVRRRPSPILHLMRGSQRWPRVVKPHVIWHARDARREAALWQQQQAARPRPD